MQIERLPDQELYKNGLQLVAGLEIDVENTPCKDLLNAPEHDSK